MVFYLDIFRQKYDINVFIVIVVCVIFEIHWSQLCHFWQIFISLVNLDSVCPGTLLFSLSYAKILIIFLSYENLPKCAFNTA